MPDYQHQIIRKNLYVGFAMRTTLLLSILLLLSLRATATSFFRDTLLIRGMVRGANGNLIISKARVGLKGSEAATQTDASGQFMLKAERADVRRSATILFDAKGFMKAEGILNPDYLADTKMREVSVGTVVLQPVRIRETHSSLSGWVVAKARSNTRADDQEYDSLSKYLFAKISRAMRSLIE